MSDSALSENSGVKAKRGTDAAVFAAYLFFAALMTWPMIVMLDHYVISEYMDAATAFYNLWWFHQAVCELHTSPWTNPLIDYPYGYSMILFPMWIPYDTLALPFLAAKGAEGMPIAFNLISLLSFALSGYAMFALVRRLTHNPGAAFVAGLALAFAPYRFWNLTRWHVTCLELVVASIYFFTLAIKDKSRGAWIGLGITLSLLFYTSPNYIADMVIALPIVLVFFAVTEREKILNRETFAVLIKAAVMAGIICAPLIIRIVLETVRQPLPLAQPESMRIPYSANLLGFVTPGFNLKAYSWIADILPYADPGLTRAHGIGGYEIFMGFSVLFLAAIGIASRKREAWLFLVLAIVFTVLSLGPQIHAGAHTFSFAAPYKWLEPILFWLKIDRTPVRHQAIALISVVALSGIGLNALSQNAGGWKSKAIFFAAGLLVLIEFNQAPLKLDKIPVPKYVYEIKADPVYGSVLDLPFLPDMQRLGGYYQMHHYKPLAIQLTSRIDDPKYHNSALYQNLGHPKIWLELDEQERKERLSELKAELRERRVRYITAYPRFMEPDDLTGLLKIMNDLSPDSILRQDNLYVVYRYPVSD